MYYNEAQAENTRVEEISNWVNGYLKFKSSETDSLHIL